MEIADSVIEIVAKHLGRDPAEINEDTDLEQEGYDSLDILETMFALEETFKVSIPFDANDRDAMGLRTVGDITKMVEGIIAKRKPA